MPGPRGAPGSDVNKAHAALSPDAFDLILVRREGSDHLALPLGKLWGRFPEDRK